MCGNYPITYIVVSVFRIRWSEAIGSDLPNLKKIVRWS
jgi:hypothetical protein